MDENQDDICKYMTNEFSDYRYAMPFMHSVAALVTTVLNSLILISIWKTPSLHKPSYILIGSLALSDLLVGAIGEPLIVIENIGALRNWSLTIYCVVLKCARGVCYSLAAVSLSTLTLISLDRLLAVKLRNRYQSIVTKKRVICLLLSSWIVVCVGSATSMVCLNLNSPNVIALLLFVGIAVLISVVTITISQSMAFFSLRKISSSVSPCDQNAEAVANSSSNIDVAKYRKSLFTMLIVFVFTLLFYSPFIFVFIIISSVFKHESSSSELPMTAIVCLTVAEFLSLLNSAMNPLLYLWRIRDIREAVKTTVKTAFKIF